MNEDFDITDKPDHYLDMNSPDPIEESENQPKRRLSDFVNPELVPVDDNVSKDSSEELTDEQKSEALIKLLLEAEPEEYEKLPSTSYSELVQA